MISIPRGLQAGNDVVRRRRLYEEVASRIEAQISSGTFKPGDRLPSERELMLRYGVGRPAVREAVFALKKMGLVAIDQGGRSRITTPNSDTLVASLSGAARHLLAAPDGVRQFQSARRFFEVGLARHAAENASRSDLVSLARSLDENRKSLGDLDGFERTDVEFHHTIVLIARNPIFDAIHQAMVTWLTEQRHITLQAPRQHELAYRAHEQVYMAIENGDADRAERMMRDHLRHVEKIYWKQIELANEWLRGDSRVSRKVR